MLRRFAGGRPKRDLHGSKTPCAELKQHTTCSDLCCRNFLVPLAQEDLEEGLAVLEPFVDVLLRDPRGHCHYFDEATTRCGIHDKRPMPCRVFDCRDDPRSDPLRHVVNLDQPFVTSAPRTCEACAQPLRLSLSVSADCDGHAVCLGCGAGYRVHFDYSRRSYAILHDGGLSALQRRVYLLRARVYHQRFAEALPLVEALVAEQPADQPLGLELAATLTELGRWDEARAVLARFDSPEATLELAWLERRQGLLEPARLRLAEVLVRLSTAAQVRACVELGRIALARGELEPAAKWFVAALKQQVWVRNPMLKEYVLDLLHGSPEGQAAVERVLLQGLRAARAAAKGAAAPGPSQ